MKLSTLISSALLVGAGVAMPAHAEEEPDGWTGEGSLSAGYTTGNTETTDVGLGLDVNHKTGPWNYSIQSVVDYGEQDGIESRNRVYLAGELDRDITDRLFSFARGSYEVDQFTGFDSRSFIGAGLGYDVIQEDGHSWTVRGGPGVKIDEVKRIVTTDDLGNVTITPAETETTFGAVLRSRYAYDFNENVQFSNNTDIVYGQESTQIGNIIALTAALNGHLSARFSFDVRHDTNPQVGFEATDTATKVALVYKIGD